MKPVQIRFVIAILMLFSFLSTNAAVAANDISSEVQKLREAEEQNRFDDAWAILEQLRGRENADVFESRAFAFYFGHGVERDVCAAVLEFERARRADGVSQLSLVFLERIYRGAYRQISAEEGNPDSLHWLGRYEFHTYMAGRHLEKAFEGDAIALQETYSLLERARMQGIDDWYRRSKVLEELTRIGGAIPDVKPDFKRVICDVRKPPK